MHDFRKLKAWQKSRLFVTEIYKEVRRLPKEEKLSLILQMKRSSVSIPANIVESCGRNSNKQLRHFLEIALGSSYELETLLILSMDLGLIDKSIFMRLTQQLIEIQKMIVGLQKSLKI